MPNQLLGVLTAHHRDFRAVLRVSLGLRPAKFHENYPELNAE